MVRTTDFELLIAEAEAQPFVGWDFSWLADRMVTQPLPWDYDGLVVERAHQSPDLLDLDTGGGEWLAALTYRPSRTAASESYPPNVSLAARRLHPLDVSVVRIAGAPDNNVQRVPESLGQLPFRNDVIHLVTNRHASFVATEVARILATGGRFITQQVGDRNDDDFYRLLRLPLPAPSPRPWVLSLAVAQVEAAGLRLLGSGEGDQVSSFADVGAFAWYLKAIPWTVPGFSISAFRRRLEDLHDRIAKYGPLQVRQSRFWLEATKTIPSEKPVVPCLREQRMGRTEISSRCPTVAWR